MNHAFYYLALKYEEVSKVIPIYYLAPVFILFIAKAILNEHLANNQYWGTALLVSGAIIISLSSPLKIGISKGVLCMLLAAFCYAINQILTKFLLKNNEFWSVFAYIRLGVSLSLLPIFVYYFSRFILIRQKSHIEVMLSWLVTNCLMLAEYFA
uniref:EamA family transporter n=1 Tax=Legionella tunisiensis TaxID=1034944 RepID=UPI0038BA90DC